MSSLCRRHVAADNNCLFTTCAYLCEGLASELDLRAAARRLRATCAQMVLADPDPSTRALMLGHETVESYGAWIRVESHWGGEPEVLMLAEHYDVEIVLTSCETCRSTTYSAGEPTSRIFILYTGQHYDPLVGFGSDGSQQEVRKFSRDVGFDSLAARAVEIAKEHNAEMERRRKEKRVKRLKCGGCGAIVADNAAFQAHCEEVEHDDDFTYECEQVEIVLGEGDELLKGHIDLESPTVHAFYNVCANDELSLAMRCTLAPFELGGTHYPTLDAYINAETVVELPSEERKAAILDAVRAQYSSEAASRSGLCDHLLSTGDKLIACIDVNPFLGIQAAGGVSTGQNELGKALMAVRAEMNGRT